MSIQPYNISLGSESPTFQYVPIRDGPVTAGWNSSYSGNIEWNGLEGSQGVGTPYRRTQLNDASFSLDFQGVALYLCLGTVSGAGYTLTVDSNAVTKTGAANDPTCDGWPGSQVLLVADGLNYGRHTAEFNATITGAAELDFYGGIITLSAGSPGTTVSAPVWVDDRSPDWIYEPGPWAQGNNPAEYNGTHTYACPYDSSVTASITFNGTSIVQLIGSSTSNTFGYSIEFNNVQTVYNSTNYWWANRQTFFFAGGLDPTQEYTLTLVDFDANQPNGPPGLNTNGFYCVNLDAVVFVQPIISNAQSTSSGSSSSTGTTTGVSTTGAPSQSSGADTGGGGSSGSGGLSGGAIAGIVIGVVVVLALIAIIWFLLSRMKRRGQGADGSGQAVFSNSYRGGTPNPPDPIPYVTPPIEPQSAFFTGPSASISTGPALSSSGYRNDKSPRSTPSDAAYAGIRPRTGPMSEGGTSSSSDPRSTNDILQNAPTVDLVTILNQRLRREQADNIEEPPTYG